MSLEDDIRYGIKKGIEDYNKEQKWKADVAAYNEFKSNVISGLRRQEQWAQELIEKGDYPEAVKIAWSVYRTAKTTINTYSGEHLPYVECVGSSWRIFEDALWKWGKACEQGSEKYPKDEAKALELIKGAAWWGNKDAQQTLKQRRVKFAKKEFSNENAFWLLGIPCGVGVSFLVSNLIDLQLASFLSRWLIKIAAFLVGFFGIGSYCMYDSEEVIRGFSMKLEPLQLYPPRKKTLRTFFYLICLVFAFFGWSSWALPPLLGLPRDTIPNIVAYYKAQAKKQPFAGDLDVLSENGAAKIFHINYGENETVISIIRTTGSHKAVSIAKPGEENSFYVIVGETSYPLKEARLRDYEGAAGVELVFDPFKDHIFDLIEGRDTSATAWQFKIGVGAPGPGGGLVFYDKGSYSDGWRYLEAAPSYREFKANWNAAVRKVRTLKIGGERRYSWRLPTIDELDLMYKTLKVNGLDEFSGAYYWSSNEVNKNDAALVLFFTNAEQRRGGKKGKYLIRAVRQI
ncbi:MAG: DUF1566 domain-containing protein [Treponema sp.]|nr:DUF1566 domain-containing protein [Treponema sp.]